MAFFEYLDVIEVLGNAMHSGRSPYLVPMYFETNYEYGNTHYVEIPIIRPICYFLLDIKMA